MVSFSVVPIYIYPSIKNAQRSSNSKKLIKPPNPPRISSDQREGRRRSLPPITVTISDDGAPNPPETPPG
ncbi:hypothetical protein CEXT_172231 [Caerostris extrusa]|uniref:Uncharacterized protein n=1 Tax=Caerostris extrusa TaxID=172846 RepID=A0AAV4X6R3_CAEEX|nr:hypothetical protein CEXT_172231 [Caerostris extrusa]